MDDYFSRNHVIVGTIDEQWQMDLADMQSMQKFKDSYHYLLVCIDVFSKYAWVVPLKNKMGLSPVEALKTILASERKLEKIITDQGTEFFNKHFKALLKDEDIGLYNRYNETKASVVERLICTLKTRMWQYFTERKPCDTSTCCRIWCTRTIIPFIPASKENLPTDNEKQVWHTLYSDHDNVKHPKNKFKIGDQVRINYQKIKPTFEKGYLPNLSREIFTISNQVPRNPPMYKLKDYDGKELKGTF